MKITRVEPFILHVPVTGNLIGDSTHRISQWGLPGVRVFTDAGIVGYGHTGTHAHLPSDRLITDCIAHTLGPLMIGEDPRDVAALHTKLSRTGHVLWLGRAGITQMALSAVDIALHDIAAKAADAPLWRLLNPRLDPDSKRVAAYNTDCGWLTLTTDELVEGCLRMIDAGFTGVKMKIGGPDPDEDMRRIKAVRAAIGDATLMVDANGKWDVKTAIEYGRRFGDHDIAWFEEPLWHDDVVGHRELATAIDTPIALGELLYHVDAFRTFIDQKAVTYLQPDATRCGGLTNVWKVADLGAAAGLPVAPHHGDMMQAQLHLVLAHRQTTLLEYIPWTLHCFVEPAEVVDGHYLTPQLPGAGTTLTDEALAKYNVLE
ncbi:MAG: mandelate racemase/muconate lactonizing enzyme family protein [Phycisphaera sp.]|nr:mandelate racemase/muconate lactonizing enzyme family protein [Phycisphaera sp.]